MGVNNEFKGKLIIIAGPTASGKTSIAIELAQYFGTEIISADSRQFYKEIPLGTAAPTYEEQQIVKHHMVGNLSVTDNYNVSLYENQVLELLNKKFNNNQVVIMAGGSGLYIDAVCKGIDNLPDIDDDIRNHVKNMYETSGIDSLISMLEELDPEYLLSVDTKNPVRLMRAVEVCIQTGDKYSELRLNKPKPRSFGIIKLGIDIPRELLVERINQRTSKMITDGWLLEAKSVYSYRSCNSLNTVGYKELFLHLDGRLSLNDAIEKIKVSTRRYAKRQMTWFRRDPELTWFNYNNISGMKEHIESRIKT